MNNKGTDQSALLCFGAKNILQNDNYENLDNFFDISFDIFKVLLIVTFLCILSYQMLQIARSLAQILLTPSFQN